MARDPDIDPCAFTAIGGMDDAAVQRERIFRDWREGERLRAGQSFIELVEEARGTQIAQRK
jgi:hypothetical protein